MHLKLRALQALWWLTTPIFILAIPQAIYVKKTTLRLPEAKGEKTFQLGKNTGSPINLVHIGESTVAGVGVEDLNQGFTHNIANQLSKLNHDLTINSTIVGENGIRFKALNQIIHKLDMPIDIAIVTMGVNDTTGLSSLKHWRENIIQAIHFLQAKGAQQIFFSHVPPMAQFPALPVPLRYLLGLRAALLNTQLEEVCNNFNDVHYLHSKLAVDKEYMAIDGYHPGKLGYQEWAKQIVPQIYEQLRP